MIHLIIGHRGTGKTTFLKRISEYHRELKQKCFCFDLDGELEKQQGRPVKEIFNDLGERAFRDLEQRVLTDLIARHQNFAGSIFIALGAGYEGSIPEFCNVIWLSRPTDPDGRVFLDRPALEPSMAPLEEYLKRRSVRESRYENQHSEKFIIGEGFDRPNSVEPVFLNLVEHTVGGILTLLPKHFRSGERWKRYIEKRLNWKDVTFELRTDLLSEREIEQALDFIPTGRLLLSIRNPTITPLIKELARRMAWDWPVEYGKCTLGLLPAIYSLHERRGGEPLAQIFKRLEKVEQPGIQLKLAIPIHDFRELESGHRWQSQAPKWRSFLPMSTSGRWQWYRLRQKGHMNINFWREDDGSAPDQPTFFDWTRISQKSFSQFAAVLGKPIHHSMTPAEQESFFIEKNVPVLAIEIGEEEFNKETLAFLNSLGLRWAAVTSPLKKLALQLSDVATEIAQTLESANTLKWEDGSWHATNTDIEGLRALIPSDIKHPVAVWGGGGTRQAIEMVCPKAKLFSMRTGDCLNDQVDRNKFSPQTVIWAVGRKRLQHYPPSHWKPQVVIDLNYTADSPGLEYAKSLQCEYISGLSMFKAQALGQRQFWR